MLKKVSLFFAVLLCFTLFSNKVLAEENKEENVIFKAKEITDPEVISSKILKGENENVHLGEFYESVSDKKQVVEVISEDKTRSKLNTIETEEISPFVQLLEITEDSNGDREEIYALSYLVDIEEDNNGIVTLSNSNTRTGTDPGGNVRARSTAYFQTKKDSSGVTHARFTKGNGGWTVLQSGVGLGKRTVIYGTVGLSRFGSTSGQRVTRNITSSTWSVTAPTSWVHAYNGNIGVNSTAKLTGRSSHTVTLNNQW